MRKSIKEILIERDGASPEWADKQIATAKYIFESYLEEGDLESAFEVCHELFNLEPDYLDEFM